MSPSLLHCRGVIVAVVLLRCLCCRIVMVLLLPSRCHLHHHIVVVLLLPSWCHLCICHGFVVAVVVLPSCRSRFHCRRHGVAFVVTLSWFRCCHGVAFIVALSRCRCHGFIVAIAVSPSSSSQLLCYGAFTVASLRFHHCHRCVAFIIALLW